MADKFTAVWLSHSSISDFLKCPRAYYLKNIYKDKETRNKLQIASPALSLGSAVHEVLESLSLLPTHKRFETPLNALFETVWSKYNGKRGGFLSSSLENQYKQRGLDMIARVQRNPGPISRKAVKIQEKLPYFWLSEEDNIILCGKVDWLEYLEEKDSVNIVDFKTSKNTVEDPESLQLPIYHLLVKNTQKWKIEGASYWYLEQNDEPTVAELPDYEESFNKIFAIAKKVKLARQLESFNCPNGADGCRECQSFERILKGEGELVGVDVDQHKDIYLLSATSGNEAEIL